MFFARSPFPFPAELALNLEKVIWPLERLMGPRREALRKLWPKLAKYRGQIQKGESHYSFQRGEADAYAAYYLPANCLKVPLVLEECFLAGIDPMPEQESRWLDLGTGPGTAYWGLAWWCAKRGKKLRFTGWDQSAVFQSIARELSAGSTLGAEPFFLAGKEDPLDLIRKIKPTHVSFVNSIAEIFPEYPRRYSEIEKILLELRSLQKADGRTRFLLIVEPGSRESSRELATLKDELQNKKLGEVLFPCLDARACGALSKPHDWCHEEAACDFPDWLNELGSGAGLRKESMLFSYALIRISNPKAPGEELRIVSQRLERKGQVECYLCTREGKRPVRVQRSKSNAANEFFLESVRGDLWLNARIGEKNDVEAANVRIPPQIISVFHE